MQCILGGTIAKNVPGVFFVPAIVKGLFPLKIHGFKQRGNFISEAIGF